MTTMRWDLIRELQAKSEGLSTEEKLCLVERLVASIRKEHFTNLEALDTAVGKMANDPEMQRVLGNEDLPFGGVESRAAG